MKSKDDSMPINLTKFTFLPDSAIVRIVPIEDGLTAEAAVPVLAVLDELLHEWRENGVIVAGAADLILDGRFVLIAYQTRAADLSGCTKDSLTHALMTFEQMLGKKLLNAPRLAVETAEGFRLVNNPEFRKMRGEGTVTDQTRVYDMLVTTLGQVREGKFETNVASSWYSRIG